MPQLRVGDTPVTNLRVGNTQAQRAYLGATLVWSPGLEWLGSPASLVIAGVWSTWGPALVPSGKTVHWDAAYESSITYRPGTTEVVSWADLSGNSWELNEPVAGTNAQLPTRKIGYNGLPILHFEADDFLVHWINSGTPDDINLAQPITIHVVAAATPYSGYPTGLIGGQGASAGGMQITWNTAADLLVAAGGFVNFSGLYSPDQHIYTMVFNGASSQQRLDGVVLGTGDVGTGVLQRLQIGITHQLMDVIACEYVFYNRVLTAPEITYNEDILRAKWFKPPGVWTGSPATVTIYASARTWYRGAAPAFRPTDIENCFGWWDADDASTFTFSSGVSVQQWRDKTSAARHLGNVAPSTEPDRTGTINGLPVVTFDGTAWMLILPEPGVAPPPQPTTVFVVATMQTYTDWTNLISGTSGGAINRAPSSSNIGFSAGVFAEYAVNTSPHLLAAVFDRGKSQQRVDGTRVGIVNTGPMEFGPLRVGTGGFAGHALRGTIAEICIYSRNLVSTEISEIESYLMGKWFGPPPPQTWNGSTPTMVITATSGSWFFPGYWFGSAATLTITATSGTWVAATVQGDNFNRADTTTTTGGLGTDWDDTTFYISSNKATQQNGDSACRFQTDLGTDHFVEADITGSTGGNYPVIYARCAAGSRANCYQGYLDPGTTTAWIGKFNSGSFATVASGTAPASGSFNLRLECQGSTQRLYVNDTLVVTGSDSTVASGGYTGIGGFSGGDGLTTWDNFTCGAL